jgi:hypothetical protein
MGEVDQALTERLGLLMLAAVEVQSRKVVQHGKLLGRLLQLLTELVGPRVHLEHLLRAVAFERDDGRSEQHLEL